MLSKKETHLKAALVIGLAVLLILLPGCDVLFNQPPIAVIKAAPTSSASAPLEVVFDASSSYDPDGQIIQYLWDFSDGSHRYGITTTHVFISEGTFSVKLTVVDNKGLKANATITIYVGSGSDINNSEVEINIPSAARINLTELTVISAAGRATVSSEGRTSISWLTAPTQVIFVENRQGNLVLLGYLLALAPNLSPMMVPAGLTKYTISNHNVPIAIDAESTALALVMIQPILIGIPAHEKIIFASKAVQYEKFAELVALVEASIVADPISPLDFAKHPSMYSLASQIALDIYERHIASTIPLAVPLPKLYPNDAPWIEDAPGKDIKLMNIKTVWYVVQPYDYDTSAKKGDWFLLGAKRWVLFVPGPPEEKSYYLGNNRISFRIEKGDITRLNDPLVLFATLVNGSVAITYVLDLILSLPLDHGPILELAQFLMGKEAIKYAIIQFLKNPDVVNALKTIIALFKDREVRDSIIEAIVQIFKKRIEDPSKFVDKISELLGNVLKVLTAPEKIAFFWDLFLAPTNIVYNVEEPKRLTYIPTIKINTPQERLEAPATINLSCNANDLDGEIISYYWDFGDGTKGYYKESVNHTYQNPGTYQLRVRVEDNDGSWAEDTLTITVNPGNRPPTVTILSPANNLTFNQGDTITFRGQATDPEDGRLSGSSLVWTSSIDGIIGTGESFTKSNLSVGAHTITLTAIDSKGASGQDSISITINKRLNQQPVAIIKASPITGAAPLTVSFDGSSSYDPDGVIVSYNWSFGDGATSSGARLNHTYSSAGAYTATLTVVDNEGATATDSITINVSQPVKIFTSITINLDPSSIPENTNRTIKVNGRLTRKDTGQGIANKKIDILFSDWPKTAFTDSNGYYQTEYSVNLHSGSYEFSASFAGDSEYEGSEARAILTVIPIVNKPPVAVIKASPTSGNAPLTVNFDASQSYDPDGRITGYEWNFGDGSLGAGVSTQHIYTLPGTYTVVLKVVDDMGAEAYAKEFIIVRERGYPDLTITEFTIDRVDTARCPNPEILFRVAIQNKGETKSSSTDICVWQEECPALTSYYFWCGNIPELNPGDLVILRGSINYCDDGRGAVTLSARVDERNIVQENNEQNNTYQVRVSNPCPEELLPDLVITEMKIEEAHQCIDLTERPIFVHLTATIKNEGREWSSPTLFITYLLSYPALLNCSNVEMREVPALAPGGVVKFDINLSGLASCLDENNAAVLRGEVDPRSRVRESNENNNASQTRVYFKPSACL